ncbi:MAG: SsrA-binding protein SmpB [Mycoplasmataceae bacterium]|jgi:SsrA-binding protein|nr:SsrA-binding protein SmpB [Mycoplasmataceae bacterium]
MHLLFPNKKLNLKYKVEETIEVGIQLKGVEVKSVVKAEANIDEAFAIIDRNDEMYLLNMYIAPFKQDSKIDKIVPTRKRKLLLHKSECIKIGHKVKKFHLTLIPAKVYILHDKVKIEIALAKHKNVHDKREDIKKRDSERIGKNNSSL